MSSNAVNIKSFINYIIDISSMIDGSAFDGTHKNQLYNYLSEGITDVSYAINGTVAVSILNKLRRVVVDGRYIDVGSDLLSASGTTFLECESTWEFLEGEEISYGGEVAEVSEVTEDGGVYSFSLRVSTDGVIDSLSGTRIYLKDGSTDKKISLLTNTGNTIEYQVSMNSILSVNSVKSLVDIMYPSRYRNHFATLRYYYGNTIPDDINRHRCRLFLINSSNISKFVSGTLYGGGGGASGAVGADGDKNASFKCTSGSGAAGGKSTIVVDDIIISSAAGGSGGASVTTGTVGGNPDIGTSGKAGSNGSSTLVSFTMSSCSYLRVNAGIGGAGGAGCAASAGGTTGSKSWKGGSGSGVTGGNAVATANEWSADGDYIFSGGGGAGSNTIILNEKDEIGGTATSKVYGKTYNIKSGSYGTSKAGGTGGYPSKLGDSSITQQSSQSTSYGTGGKAGASRKSVDVYNAACGGNGGNRGGFVVDTTCKAIDALMSLIHDQ